MTRPVVLDLFAGGGGAAEGYRRAGFDVIGIDIADHRKSFSCVGEFHQMDWAEGLEKFGDRADFIHASPPCFPAGTPVITARGVVAIESVTVGDLVLTHKGRWRSVTDTMTRQAEVFSNRWLSATADHPFWTRRRIAGDRFDEPAWRPAGEMHGTFTAVPCAAEPLAIPSADGVLMNTAFWYVVGRWLGDGWVRIKEKSPQPRRPHGRLSPGPRPCLQCDEPAVPSIRWPHMWTAYCSTSCRARYQRAHRPKPCTETYICCSFEEADKMEAQLAETEMHWYRSRERTTVRFCVASAGLTRWLVAHFGRYSHGKTLPGWLLGATEDVRHAVLHGYLDADGNNFRDALQVHTVSDNLAIGMRVLASTLGYATSLSRHAPSRKAEIEGRRVNEKPLWNLIMRESSRLGVMDDKHYWLLWRKPLTSQGVKPVYDITVDEDHSFIAWGFAVHNCQDFSRLTNWGRRENLRRHQSLTDEGQDSKHPRLIEPVREALLALGKPFVIENVEGAPLFGAITLCGWMFGYETYRHRLFEAHGIILGLGELRHRPHIVRTSSPGHFVKGTFMSIGGHFAPVKLGREVMDSTWMTVAEISESIPPYFTHYLGEQVLDALGFPVLSHCPRTRQPGPEAQRLIWDHVPSVLDEPLFAA